jgi:hypothetical protein
VVKLEVKVRNWTWYVVLEHLAGAYWSARRSVDIGVSAMLKVTEVPDIRSLGVPMGVVSAIAACMLSTSALADEVWVCGFPAETARYGLSETRYWLHEKRLNEIGLPGRFYDVLYDNDVGIVAAWGSAAPAMIPGLPENHSPSIGVEAFAIDRKSGKAVKGFTKLFGPPPSAEHGTCHLQTAGEPGALWPPGFQK